MLGLCLILRLMVRLMSQNTSDLRAVGPVVCTHTESSIKLFLRKHVKVKACADVGFSYS